MTEVRWTMIRGPAITSSGESSAWLDAVERSGARTHAAALIVYCDVPLEANGRLSQPSSEENNDDCCMNTTIPTVPTSVSAS